MCSTKQVKKLTSFLCRKRPRMSALAGRTSRRSSSRRARAFIPFGRNSKGPTRRSKEIDKTGRCFNQSTFEKLMQDLISKTDTLLEALPYIQKFSGATFVVKYGGSF